MKEDFVQGNEYYESIYFSSPIGIELFDEKGLLIHANPACLDIFGIFRFEICTWI